MKKKKKKYKLDLAQGLEYETFSEDRTHNGLVRLAC